MEWFIRPSRRPFILSSGGGSAAAAWHQMAVGGGGLVSGLDMTSDGTKVCRTDVGGGYVYNSGAGKWVQLITVSTMPAGDINPDQNGGVYELRICPSNTSQFYMIFNGWVYVTTNGGATWTKTNFTRQTGWIPGSSGSGFENGGVRFYGQKMAVDPINPNIVFIGDPVNGWLWKTSDGGTTWTHDTGVATCTATDSSTGQLIGITGICFDPSGGSVSGATQKIYCSNGTNVYVTTNGGLTWTALTAPPAVVRNAFVANGFYYCTSDSSATTLYRSSGSGAWTTFNLAVGTIGGSQNGSLCHSVSVLGSPAASSHIVVGDDGGAVAISLNGGSTWQGWAEGTLTATDVPWLTKVGEVGYMTCGNILFDPSQANTIIISEGIGVWSATPPTSAGVGTFAWNSITKGIEELQPHGIICPNGHPVVCCDDRTCFYIADPTVYPSINTPNTQAIDHGWAIEYATADSTFMVLASNDTTGLRKSTDGGQTWAALATKPYAMNNACVAVQSSSSIMVCGFGGTQVPQVTTNGGTSWAAATYDVTPPTSTWGHGSGVIQLGRVILAADRVTSGVFYAYNPGSTTTNGGLYKSTNGGVSFIRQFTGPIIVDNVNGISFSEGQNNAKLRAAPGNAGHLWFTNGQQGGWGDVNPAPGELLMHSTDGGATWSAPNSNVLEVYDFGFGMSKPGGSGYPAIFIVGWVSGVFGVFQSDDAGVTWTQVGGAGVYPNNLYDFASTTTCICGDMTTYGKCFVGTCGNGWVWYG